MKAPWEAGIPGLPDDATAQLLERISRHQAVTRVVLYGSRALGRHHSGSDIDLCLEAPGMDLGELLELGAELDDLLLPWQVDLQMFHRLDHAPLQDHIARVGRDLWKRSGSRSTPPLQAIQQGGGGFAEGGGGPGKLPGIGDEENGSAGVVLA